MTGETTPVAHLAAADPVMARLIRQIGPLSMEKRRRGRPRTDAYGALLRAVVGQQLSTKAAATIYGRVLALFDGEVPTPQQLLGADVSALRAAGLSGRKIEYLRDLATHVLDGTLEVDRFAELDDETVIREIVAVRGLGEWTAHMFCMFHLERPDILPVGDLGIRNAVRTQYELDDLPNREQLERIAEPWRPHRTLACLYLWESLDNAPDE
ncbi:MAG TPA: DNA-3-methyladenine glycosylase [Solirubrobacterales bacterium]|jgi:DNA-3-methyladenine glycosylase II